MTPTNPSLSAAIPIGPLEKDHLTLGFVALSDCASLVMANELGLFERYGLTVTLVRQPSWAALRDRLVVGEIDAAHVLYGLVYGVHLGVGGLQKDMAILMGLNRNGQGIVLSQRLREEGVVDAASLKSMIARGEREITFAQTFPTGTHAMWLNYWLAAAGIDPRKDVRVITIAPSLMAQAMRAGNVDGFCVGEPWSGLFAAQKDLGFRVTSSQAIWRDHPEKVLGTTDSFVRHNPNTARAMIAALLEASRYVDAPAHRDGIAQVISGEQFVDAPIQAVLASLSGEVDDGLGQHEADPDRMKFFDGGKVNYPYLSDAMWFLTQLRRWGLVEHELDYAAVARAVNRTDLYAGVARSMGIALPASPFRTNRLFDGIVWDADQVHGYLGKFVIAAP